MRDKHSKILAVDDTTDNLFIMQAILSEEGYCVSTSSSGLDALALVEGVAPRFTLVGCNDARSRRLRSDLQNSLKSSTSLYPHPVNCG